MDKRIGMVGMAVFCILAVVVCYGFFSAKSEKPAMSQAGLSMPFPDMMNQLSRDMSLWVRLNPEEKKLAVDAVISLYKNRENIAILNNSDFYVGKIDDSVRSNPIAVNMNIMTILRVIAVMEYDFFNGTNKDDLARQTLGEKAFIENQNRRQALAQQQGK